jgi:hypothetical protein
MKTPDLGISGVILKLWAHYATEAMQLCLCSWVVNNQKKEGRVSEVHACNPSYPGGRDQEDRSLKPAQANSLWNPISKNPSQKLGLVEWLKVKALSSSPSTAKNEGRSFSSSSTHFLLFNHHKPGCTFCLFLEETLKPKGQLLFFMRNNSLNKYFLSPMWPSIFHFQRFP